MKNPAPQLRKKIFSLLNGNVTYNGDPIPVLEVAKFLPNQVFIGGYSQTGIADKHSFQANGEQLIEIITIKANDGTSKNSDAITELVMNLLHPEVGSNFLNTEDFNVYVQAMPDMSPIREESMSGVDVVRRLLRYRLLIDHL